MGAFGPHPQLTECLPTHSTSATCRATVLCTKKGSPEPLPVVQSLSRKSWGNPVVTQPLPPSTTPSLFSTIAPLLYHSLVLAVIFG